MAGNFVAENCRVVPFRLAATTLTKVFTATGYTQLIGVRAVNYHVSATPVLNLEYQPGGGGATGGPYYYVQANYAMPVAAGLWFEFEAFSLKDKDELYAQASVANAVDLLIAIAEVPGRSS